MISKMAKYLIVDLIVATLTYDPLYLQYILKRFYILNQVEY